MSSGTASPLTLLTLPSDVALFTTPVADGGALKTVFFPILAIELRYWDLTDGLPGFRPFRFAFSLSEIFHQFILP